jgi:small multidrug resistance pump
MPGLSRYDEMYYKLLLAVAILAEVIATSSLKSSQSLTKFVPSVMVVVGYAIAYYLMSVIVEKMYVGTVYAVWCGFGIVLVSAFGWWKHGQALDLPAILGIILILAGVVIINLYSSSMK